MRVSFRVVVFLCMALAFIAYSIHLYLLPVPLNHSLMQESAVQGKIVWQKNNCQACHQLYGLGGYLGPDLTNVYSAKDRGSGYIGVMIRNGSATMPSFTLEDSEVQNLTDFLKSIDATGKADPRNFNTTSTGDIRLKDETRAD